VAQDGKAPMLAQNSPYFLKGGTSHDRAIFNAQPAFSKLSAWKALNFQRLTLGRNSAGRN
jgi:hypothetical protein